MTPILPPLSVLSRRMTGGGRPEYEDSEMGDVSALSPSPSVASVGQGQGFRRLEGGFEDEERERERDLPLGVRIDPRIGVFNAADAQVEGRMPSVGSFAPAPGLGLGLVGSEMDRLAVAAAQRGSVTPNELERLD